MAGCLHLAVNEGTIGIARSVATPVNIFLSHTYTSTYYTYTFTFDFSSENIFE